MKIRLFVILAFFAFFSPMDLYGQKLVLWVEVEDSDQLLLPPNGYFNLDSMKCYHLGQDLPPKPIPFADWKPDELNKMLPTFYAFENNGKPQETAFLANRQIQESLVAKSNESSKAYGFWSSSLRRNVQSRFKFGILTESGFLPAEKSPSSACDLNEYFLNDNDFIQNLVVLDLTFATMEESSYQKIENLPKLRKLALPFSGADIAHPEFKANQGVEELVLWNAPLTRAAIEKIASFKNLKRLVLNGCSLSFYVGPNTYSKLSSHVLSDVGEDPLTAWRSRLEHLTIVNCDKNLINLVEAFPWSVKVMTLDFPPFSVDATFPKLEKLKVLVDKRYAANYFEGAHQHFLECSARKIVPKIVWSEGENEK